MVASLAQIMNQVHLISDINIIYDKICQALVLMQKYAKTFLHKFYLLALKCWKGPC